MANTSPYGAGASQIKSIHIHHHHHEVYFRQNVHRNNKERNEVWKRNGSIDVKGTRVTRLEDSAIASADHVDCIARTTAVL